MVDGGGPGVDSRDEGKHTGRNDLLFVKKMLPPYILFEKCIHILALEMASPGNQHCANCIGTLSFPMVRRQSPSSIWMAETLKRFRLQTEASSHKRFACRHE